MIISKFKHYKNIIQRIKTSVSSLNHLYTKNELILINQGRILSNLNKKIDSQNLRDYEFKVFSQWGEDGIIQYLIQNLEIPNKTFIEFGVEDYSESNTRFLLMKDNWSGFIVDNSRRNIDKIKRSTLSWKFDLQTFYAFLTRENINEILLSSNFPEDLGLLSIDVDGLDLHFLDALNTFKPRILIVEYNSLFGCTRKITVPYKEEFFRTNEHFSNLYYGASLAAINFIANKRGYRLVGTNSNGVNAFFVREDIVPNTWKLRTVEDLFTARKFRESRDSQGKLNYLTHEQSTEIIRGLPVLNVETGMMEII
jgi:hypothetical protein